VVSKVVKKERQILIVAVIIIQDYFFIIPSDAAESLLVTLDAVASLTGMMVVIMLDNGVANDLSHDRRRYLSGVVRIPRDH